MRICLQPTRFGGFPFRLPALAALHPRQMKGRDAAGPGTRLETPLITSRRSIAYVSALLVD